MSEPSGARERQRVRPARRRALRRLTVAAGAIGAVVAVGGVTPVRAWSLLKRTPKALAPVPMKPVVWADFLGVNAQLQWFSPEIAQQQVKHLQALGLSWVRLALHWMLLEPEPGQHKLEGTDRMMALVRQAGLHSIVYVVGSPRFASSAPAGAPYADKYPPSDPQVYAQRMVALAQRYPMVDVWQVWNEPNIPAFWQPRIDPEGYARLLQPAVAALRKAVPNKPIAMAGMAYHSEMAGRGGLMLDAMGKLGAYKLKLIACYHPYTAEPEGAEDGARDFLTHTPFVNKGLRAYGVQQIWATEWGWSSYDGPKEEQPIVGEAGQAGHTLKRLALMATQDFDRIFLFTLADLDARAGVRDRRYGLLREDGSPKPVYHALRRFLAVCGPRLAPGAPVRVAGSDGRAGSAADELPEGLVSIAWQRADGQRLWMAWAHAPMAVSLPGLNLGQRKAVWHQPVAGTQREVRAEAGQPLRLDVGTELQILVW